MSSPVNCQGIVTFEGFIVQIPVQRGLNCVQLLQPVPDFIVIFLNMVNLKQMKMIHIIIHLHLINLNLMN